MAEKFSTQFRSQIMSKVHSKDTTTEIAVRRALHWAGYRFRLHRRDLPGCPDLVLRRFGVAVFVQGCLWHGHDCRKFRWPKANAEYWRRKIERNKNRDVQNFQALATAGWDVQTVWYCDLKRDIASLLEHIRAKEQK